MNREDKRGIFFGVVGVLTLIVAIIGASLAYFSINARSDSDAIKVEAATVQIIYEDGKKVLAQSNMIPSTQTIAVKAYNRYLEDSSTYEKCIDDNDQVVCGTYNFTVRNEGRTATPITITVEPTEITDENGTPIEHKKFKNLSYILYDVSELDYNETLGDYIGEVTEDNIVKEGVFASEWTGTGNDVKVTNYLDTVMVSKDDNLSIPANSEKNYRLFIWLNELSTEDEPIAQDYEQGAMFQGAVSIEVSDTSGTITGTIE